MVWRYDDICRNRLKQHCQMIVNLPRVAPKGTILFIQLNGFRQADRRMITSWSHEQVMGAEVSIDSESKVCSPDVTNREMEKYWAVAGNSLEPDALAYPCGLLSKYYPQDTFEFTDSKRGDYWQAPISAEGISWYGLKGNKFRSIDKTREWVNIESERLINWMRPNTWTNVYKAWGRLEDDLPAGQYTVKIFNDLDPDIFAGQKLFGLSVLSPLGGRNPFVPATLWCLCIIALFLAGVFKYLSVQEEDIIARHSDSPTSPISIKAPLIVDPLD